MRNGNRFGLFLQLALMCLLFLGIGRCIWGRSVNHTSTNPFARCNGTRFVFADLDGDRIPDLAQIELQYRRSARTNYSIHLRLSAGVESAIGLSAPDGGLRVAARDVNGDDALDIIVTSNLDADFVAVLLNDGHGNFSLAKRDEFVRPENELSGTALSGPDGAEAGRVSLAISRFSSDLGTVKRGQLAPLFLARGYSTMVAEAVLYGFVCRYGSRSPPSSIASS